MVWGGVHFVSKIKNQLIKLIKLMPLCYFGVGKNGGGDWM